MLSELRKSINYIIYERTTSPFWGAFIFSWLICNWKIVFSVFVISENQLSINKIDYISNSFIDWKPLALYPFISTFILIVIFPLIGNGAYWMTLIYSEWRMRTKNNVEKKQLLSLEQSIELKSYYRAKESALYKLLDDKEDEIKSKNLEINELNRRLSEPAEVLVNRISEIEKKSKLEIWSEEFESFINQSHNTDFGRLLADLASNRYIGNFGVSTERLAYYSSIDIIEKKGSSYNLTDKGKLFSKLYYEKKNIL